MTEGIQELDKEMFLIRGTESESRGDFAHRIISLTEKTVLPLCTGLCRAVFTAEPPPRMSIIPYTKKLIACISVTGAPKPPAAAWADIFAEVPGIAGGYAVENAVPVGYTKDWEDGRPTPGAGLFTLFTSVPGIDYDTFIRRWHNSHTPLSLKIHPLWNYNRNVVKNSLFPGSEKWHGIVEEHFRERRDLVNPRIFFGGFPKMFRHMAAVWKDTNSFIDRKTIEPYFVAEYCFSPVPRPARTAVEK
jgi:hypothetical protein